MYDIPMMRFSELLERNSMENKKYKVRYLPVFQEDLIEATTYISNVLKNPTAANKLLEQIEKTILETSKDPLLYEPYRSAKQRKATYYRIFVKNFVVYYVVIDDVMEVRRLLYKSRNTADLLY